MKRLKKIEKLLIFCMKDKIIIHKNEFYLKKIYLNFRIRLKIISMFEKSLVQFFDNFSCV